MACGLRAGFVVSPVKMPRNVELKALLRDKPKILKRLQAFPNCSGPRSFEQTDTFFSTLVGPEAVPPASLKLREFADGRESQVAVPPLEPAPRPRFHRSPS